MTSGNRKPIKGWSASNAVAALSVGLASISIACYLIVTHHNQSSQPSASLHHIGQPLTRTTQQPEKIKSPRRSLTDLLNDKRELLNYNRQRLQPLLRSLVELDYFRYVKVNLNKPCQLWCNTDKCNSRDCRVKVLSDKEQCPIATYDEELSTVNTELATGQLDLLTNLFECNDNDDHNLQYVDLHLNPERYTGYSGETANRIWRAIYEENCFIRKAKTPFSQELCYEERLFYEAISGLHSSINIHLSAEYPSNSLVGSFEPNLEEFQRRFEGHSDYLENLFTLFHLELKALTLTENYLTRRFKWPENSSYVKDAVQDLFKVVGKVDNSLSSNLFLKPSEVSNELAAHFRNITTTIIDCVACDKCKLWGKVQLRGLGVAFKILSLDGDMKKLHLSNQDIVSLVNGFTRLSHSIRHLEIFRDLQMGKKANHFINR